jgi:hypothetical protein
MPPFEQKQIAPRKICALDEVEIGEGMAPRRGEAVAILEEDLGLNLRRQVVRQRDQDQVETPVQKAGDKPVRQLLAKIDLHLRTSGADHGKRARQQEGPDRRDRPEPQ